MRRRITLARNEEQSPWWLIALSAALLTTPARGAESGEYLADLQAASKLLAKKTRSSSAPLALAASASRQQTYRTGDRWEVAAFAEVQTQTRGTAPEGTATTPVGRTGRFRYEVTRADEARTVIRVTQLEPVVDPKVEWLELELDGKRKQIGKTYKLGGAAHPIRVSADGLRARTSILELFPLDFPTLSGASNDTAASEEPALPQPLARLTRARIDLRSARHLAADDFFGRGVEVYWDPAAPWPAYLKTPAGISVLVTGTERSGR